MPDYCEVALPVPLDQPFYYSVPDSFRVRPGMRVIVPFGARKLLGVVVRVKVQPEGVAPAAIKPLQGVLEQEPALPEELLRLGRWISSYYLVPEGETLAALLPRNPPVRRAIRVVLTAAGEEALRRFASQSVLSGEPGAEHAVLQRIARSKGLRRETLRGSQEILRKLGRKGWVAYEQKMEASSAAQTWAVPADDLLPSAGHVLTRRQKEALHQIEQQMEAGRFGVFLLHGVTGSGKTEVYLRAMERALRQGRTALLLVPEINLTPAMAALFAARFGSQAAVLHSGLSDKERAAAWQRVREGQCPVVMGTRSAVLAPLDRPLLVIVDEEHDSSYKQEEAPRYNGRDVAIVRAKEAGGTVILGSATPAVETRWKADTKKYRLLELEQRVLGRALAETEVIDMREEFAETGQAGFLSRRLAEEIARRLEQREQSLVLLNRRGYSAFVLCRSCGQSIQCQNCSIALTHHRRFPRLLCHYCGFARAVPRRCPQCASEHLYFVGEGSERIEETLHQRFPQARIGRLDRDTARGRGRAEAILAAFRNHELDILVGTQMIAKGHDIHRVTFAGVISADTGLGHPDFRAAERTFQLLTQVAGRAGRGELPGRVVIQTYFPDHYAVQAAAAQDYALFYEREMRFRRAMHYPPFSALANLIVRHSSVETAAKLTGALGRHLETMDGAGLKVLGPAAAPIHRLKGSYRYHFLLKAEGRRVLRETLLSCRDFARSQGFPAGALVIDVDPQSFS